MNNGRFATSLHILNLLAQAGGELLSSEYMAGSVNVNPVVIRKELSNLRKAGLVLTKEGKNGGSQLARPARKILLSDVYRAVRQDYLLGKHINDPNPNCEVGRQINRRLDELFEEVEAGILQKLGKKTLAEFNKQFN